MFIGPELHVNTTRFRKGYKNDTSDMLVLLNLGYVCKDLGEIEEAKKYKDLQVFDDPDVRYYACVVDKNRAGAKPKLLFRLNLAYNEWFELGYLRMKQKLK